MSGPGAREAAAVAAALADRGVDAWDRGFDAGWLDRLEGRRRGARVAVWSLLPAPGRGAGGEYRAGYLEGWRAAGGEVSQ